MNSHANKQAGIWAPFQPYKHALRWVLLGFWLLVLFYVNISVVLMSLTAHQLLHKVSLIEVNGQTVSITDIREFMAAEDGIEKYDEDARKTYNSALESRKQIDRKIETQNAIFNAAQTALNKAEIEFSMADNAATRAENNYGAAVETRDAATPDSEDYEDAVANVKTVGAALTEAAIAYDSKADKRDALKKAVENAAKDVNQTIDFRETVTYCNEIRAQNAYNRSVMDGEKTYNKYVTRFGYEANQKQVLVQRGQDSVTKTESVGAAENTQTENQANSQASETSADGETKTSACDTIKTYPSVNIITLDSRVQGIMNDIKYFRDLSSKKTSDEPSNPKTSSDETSNAQQPGSASAAAADSVNAAKPKYKVPLIHRLKIWKIVDFTHMPMEFLTISLVLAMGMLGGSIRLTRNYLQHEENETLAHYLFFPLLGAVTAFAVYVLAKAGVLIISDSGSSGKGGGLSPYFISFIGLVSGLLADNALDTIQKVGSGWFKDTGAGPERWGVNLAQKCKAAKASVTDIANIVGCSPATVEKWFSEANPVPAEAQRLIAARLHKPVREVFSDMPPHRSFTDAKDIVMTPDAAKS